jgi:hypothetical protein
MLDISFSIIKLLYNVKYDTFFIVNLVHVYIKEYDSVIRLRLPNDKIIKPEPSSEYIFKHCTLHVCSGLLMWTVFFLKKKGKSHMHACLGCMYACFTFIYRPGILICFLACNNNDGKLMKTTD